MPGMPASVPHHAHPPPAAAGCHCCKASHGKASQAAPPQRSRSSQARDRFAARGLCLNCGRVHPPDGAERAQAFSGDFGLIRSY